jgi:iron complex outermembrane receptor protein
MHESLRGSAGFRSEVERSLEAGYRMQSGQRWSMDVSGFWSRYDGLRSVTASIPSLAIGAQGLYLEAPAIITNGGTGRTRGGEVSGTVQVLPGWRVMPAWSYARDERSVEPGLFPGQSDWDRRPSDLRQQGLFRSQHDLARNWQLDLMARVRGRDHNFDLPGVLLFDARLAWQATRGTEISVTVHNLTNRHVLEAFAEGGVPSIPVRRTVLFQWVQRF